jgi:hypothetical protein
MSEPRKRRRRDQRRDHPPPMRLQRRDIHVVEAVYQCRILRQDQIQALFFSSKSTAQYRLERLYDHEFLDRRFLPVAAEGGGRSPTLYVLDKRGAELLRRERGYDELKWSATQNDFKTDFLEHTLAINAVRISVMLACRSLGYTLLEWRSESDLKADYDRVRVRDGSGKEKQVAVLPDSYFAIGVGQRKYPFVLELDRGTMTLKRFQQKIQAYLAYHQTGGYERRFGSKSIRVLTVTLSERRLANLKHVSEEAGASRWFWFARLSELTPQSIFSLSVWQVAGEEQPQPLIGM